jgi:hypothetical protein
MTLEEKIVNSIKQEENSMLLSQGKIDALRAVLAELQAPPVEEEEEAGSDE